MTIQISLRSLFLVTIFAGALACTSALAQSYEDQAKTILLLFESGKKDSAYLMIEPLKRSARFVPAVLYTRARMTPDDRALALFKEIIALEPGGPWADKAAYQLVSRYADKGDSLAAFTWADVLRSNYPRSTMIAQSEDLLKGVKSWRAFVETPATDAPPKRRANTSTDTIRTKTTRTTTNPNEPPLKPRDTYKQSGMKGFALQVGLYPTREKADARAAELKKKNLNAVALPKTVSGRKHYALVVGPYTSIDDASNKKTGVASQCDCQAFIVKVQ